VDPNLGQQGDNGSPRRRSTLSATVPQRSLGTRRRHWTTDGGSCLRWCAQWRTTQRRTGVAEVAHGRWRWLPGRRGTPRRCCTRGGTSGDGPGQRPLVVDVVFGSFSGWPSASRWPPAGCAREGGGVSGRGRRWTRQLRRQLTGKRQWWHADNGCWAWGSASGLRSSPDRVVGRVLDRGRVVGSRTHGGQVEGGR
jgi:hypothetical protein